MFSQHMIDRLMVGGGMLAVFLLAVTVFVVIMRRTGGDVENEVEGLKRMSEKHQQMKQDLKQSQNKNDVMEKLLTMSEEDRKALMIELEKKKDGSSKS
jgi:flagellar motor component MotA